MPILAEPFVSLEDYLAWASHRPDAEQYEVVDGQPVMSPSPHGMHQLVLSRLSAALRDVCPAGHEVIQAPWDWLLWERPRLQIRQPDLLVVPRELLNYPRLLRAPLLAVEVLSAASLERDVVAKLRDYGRAGLDHYWVVDPDAPQIAVYGRRSDTLVLTTLVSGDEDLVITEPLSVRLRPTGLVS